MEYFVIAPDGQRYGPASVAVLNQWIQEGRVGPQTLLQEAATGAEIVARALPALNFVPRPAPAPPNANPYTMASPAANPLFYAPPSRWDRPALVSPQQALTAWFATFLAPPLMLFCYVGLAAALFALVTGGQLVKQGNKTAGGVMIGLNVLSLVGFIVLRLWGALR